MTSLNPFHSNYQDLTTCSISSKPLVTALICNYNYGRFLAEAIDSALAQTWQPLEVLVVDDGSIDESRSVLERYQDRIRVILKENGGQASAFNIGISEAHGEIICFLDSDDLWHTGKVERIVAKYKEASWGLVCHHLNEVDETGQKISKAASPKSPTYRLISGDLFDLVIKEGFSWVFSPTSGMSLPRQIAQKIFPLPEKEWRICADNPIAYAAICHAPVGVIDESLGTYRYHGVNGFSSIRQEPVNVRLYSIISRIERYLFLKDYLARLGCNILNKEPKDWYPYYRRSCFITRERPWRYLMDLWRKNVRYHSINKLPRLNAFGFLLLDTLLAALMFLHLPTTYRALKALYRLKALSLDSRVKEYFEMD